MARKRQIKALTRYNDKRVVDRVLDETEDGEMLKQAIGDKENLLREYMYDAYVAYGNIGLGAFVAMFYEDGGVFPKRERLSKTDPTEWKRIQKQVFKRDNYTCAYCGRKDVKLEVDHVIPFSRGGSDSLENLVTSCATCNRQKKDKTRSEFMKWRCQVGKTAEERN